MKHSTKSLQLTHQPNSDIYFQSNVLKNAGSTSDILYSVVQVCNARYSPLELDQYCYLLLVVSQSQVERNTPHIITSHLASYHKEIISHTYHGPLQTLFWENGIFLQIILLHTTMFNNSHYQFPMLLLLLKHCYFFLIIRFKKSLSM